jgi:hypothetical protein
VQICPFVQSSALRDVVRARVAKFIAPQNLSGFRPAPFGELNSLFVGGHAQLTGFLEGLAARRTARQLEGFGKSFVGSYGRIMNIRSLWLKGRHELIWRRFAIGSTSDCAAGIGSR